jgi:hypothetical protein
MAYRGLIAVGDGLALAFCRAYTAEKQPVDSLSFFALIVALETAPEVASLEPCFRVMGRELTGFGLDLRNGQPVMRIDA